MAREHPTGTRRPGAVRIWAVCGLIAAAPAAAAEYLGPVAVVASREGGRLFVANSDAGRIAVVDAAGGRVTASIAVPAKPTGIALGPRGARLYVTCAAPKSVIVVLDAASGRQLASIPTGHTATGPAISPDGKTLYVCNRFDNAVAVIDLATNKEVARVPTAREPIAAAVTPDGKTVFVANHLPAERADAHDVAAAVTAIDTASRQATSIRLANGSSGLRGICVSPDGELAYAVHVLARHQMPTTQVERGWMNTSAMSVIDAVRKKLLNTVLLDDVELGAANPWGVACTPDGRSVCVTHAGTHELSVIDARVLLEKLAAAEEVDPAERRRVRGELADRARLEDTGQGLGPHVYDSSITAAEVPNDLAFLVGLRRRICLQGDASRPETSDPAAVNGPRGLVVAGSKVYAAAYFTDNLAVVDLEPKPVGPVSTIALGPRPKLTARRRGEMCFNDATLCFQRWQSCASCHPDARADGLNWDLMNDGLGNPKNAKSMLLAHRTPPAMSSGIRAKAEVAVRAGISHILFSVRPEGDAAAIDEYLKSLRPVQSPYLVDGKLSPAAERGRKLFFDKEVGCGKCHPAPLYTDLQMRDVASRSRFDRRATFDTPTLVECWRTAPYMHDGQYATMKELFTKGKHGNTAGKVDKLSDKEIDDLVEFVLSL